jgi:ubiquinone/menaquinone biosynthesis C-methylase UbiE
MSVSPQVDETSVQAPVTEIFEHGATFWTNVYTGSDVFASIHRRRLRLALGLTDRLRLAAGTRVLDMGGGTGVAAVELARRDLVVTVVDPAGAMLRATRERARAAGVADRVTTVRGDAHRLGLADREFGLVVALGLIPWLHEPDMAMGEAYRLLTEGGWLITNIDNLLRLNHLLDPRYVPRISTAAKKVRDIVAGAPVHGEPRPCAQTRRAFVGLLRTTGFEVESTLAYGFGPFTMLGRPLLPDALAVSLDRRLSPLAERGVPLLRSTGSQVMALARRPLGRAR